MSKNACTHVHCFIGSDISQQNFVWEQRIQAAIVAFLCYTSVCDVTERLTCAMYTIKCFLYILSEFFQTKGILICLPAFTCARSCKQRAQEGLDRKQGRYKWQGPTLSSLASEVLVDYNSLYRMYTCSCTSIEAMVGTLGHHTHAHARTSQAVVQQSSN